MTHYRDWAGGRLHRSTTSSKHGTVISRTSKQAWLPDFTLKNYPTDKVRLDAGITQNSFG